MIINFNIGDIILNIQIGALVIVILTISICNCGVSGNLVCNFY